MDKLKYLVLFGVGFLLWRMSRSSPEVGEGEPLRFIIDQGQFDIGTIGGSFQDYRSIIRSVQKHHPGLASIPEGLVLAIIEVESSGDSGVYGAAGEIGLMQISPAMYRAMNQMYGVGPDSSASIPYYNILAGMWFLYYLYGRYADWDRVIQTYNIGEPKYNAGTRSPSYLAKVKSAWSGLG